MLIGSRIVAYVHDEFLLEVRDDADAHDKAHEMARVMKEAANEWLPDCPFQQMGPLLMRCWSKEAEPMHDANGRLVPWEPALGGVIGMGSAVKARMAA